jgi:acetyltransferase-like isoleucine patch superfamily enzyme
MLNNKPAGYKNFIRRIFSNLFFYTGRFTSIIYGFKLNLYIKELYKFFYSGWLFKNFKSCGKGLSIAYPMYGTGLRYISIGNNFISGPRLRIEAFDQFLYEFYNPKIIIGNNVNINSDCHLGCIVEINIGNDVLVASKVLIIDHFHGETTLDGTKLAPMQRPLVSKGKISIGNNVWVGEGCIIMPGVSIGENCILGANSVITKNFEANSVIGGNPARIIKYLK